MIQSRWRVSTMNQYVNMFYREKHWLIEADVLQEAHGQVSHAIRTIRPSP